MSLLNEIDTQINSILSFVKQMPKSISRNSSPNLILYGNKNSMSSRNNNQQKSLSNNSFSVSKDNQSDSITTENFPFTHLCNRDVDLTIFSSIE